MRLSSARSSLPRPILLLALALVASSCAEVGKLAAAAIQRPTLTYRSVDLQSADLEGVTLAFLYDVENPNRFGLTLARLSYGLEVQSNRVVTGEVPGGVRIPAAGKAPITFTARLRYRDVPGLVQLLGREDTLRYRLSGTVGLSTPVGPVDLPLSHDGSVHLPQLPRISLAGLGVRSMSFTHVTVEVRLRVENPNEFPVPAGRLAATLALEGKPLAEVAGQGLAALPRRGAGELVLPVRIELARAGKAAADLAAGRPLNVTVGGTAEVGGLSWPLQLSGRLAGR